MMSILLIEFDCNEPRIQFILYVFRTFKMFEYVYGLLFATLDDV